ncbi:hypothetical protein [Streptomyces sp. NPDC102476]|uniref:hypothetical protein n=1 Tax=Streptomyces sp. NPDC102476 TaxID=3366181 RepID=UPI003802B3A1
MPYKVWNGPAPTTASQAAVTTGTALKTMLQIATPSTRQIQLISWGYSIESGPSTGPLKVELLQTDVAATVTAHVASGVQNLDPNGTASLVTLGTSATGYTATVEGTPTASRVFDFATIGPNSSSAATLDYAYQWMPDERPIVAVSKFLRVRATFATAANMVCWVVFNEVG